MTNRNKNRVGYKETKLGWIPIDWSVCPFNEILTRTMLPVNVHSEKWYQEIGIKSHGRGIFHKARILGVELGNKAVFWVQVPALMFNIVFAWEQAVAVSSERERGMIGSHRFPMYRPRNEGIDLHYVCYYFLTNKGKHLLGMASPGGAGRNKTLGQKELALVPIPVPSLSEQQKIAEIISTWDEAIEQTRKLFETKKRRKKALMQQLLTGKKRLSNFGKSESRQSYRFLSVPEKWECPRVREIAQECKERNTGSTGLTVFSCSKHRGFVKSTDYFGKQVFSEDTSNYKVIRRGWFGYPSNHVEEGSIGLLLTDEAGLVSPIYTVFRCNSDVVPEFLFAVFKTDTFRHIFAVSTNASVDRRGSLRWNEFSLIRVPLPSVEEQRAIVEVLSLAEAEIAHLERQLGAHERQKRGLMQKLLTGEVRVRA
jgi:type I restriction enzyme, S subunit